MNSSPDGCSNGAMRWAVEHVEGTAQALHDLEVEPRRIIRVNQVTAPALVLGSRQRTEDLPGVLPPGAGLATRRSGGGAVWLVPGSQFWVDVVVPVDDPLHSDDIRVAARWLGDVWSAVLGEPARTWQGAMSAVAASQRACFAGVGPGEVVVGERKLVGISQRRTSSWSRMQSVVHHRWDPEPLLVALDLVDPEPGHSSDALRSALIDGVAVLGAPPTAGIPAELLGSPGDLEDHLLEQMIGVLEGQ